MKTILLIAALLIGFQASAQTKPITPREGDLPPFKDCNTIIVRMAEPPTFRDAANLLMNNGYTLAAINELLGFITSEPRPFENNMWALVVTVRINGDKIELSAKTQVSGQVTVGGTGGGGNFAWQASYRNDWTKERKAFDKLYALAIMQPKGHLEYEIR